VVGPTLEDDGAEGGEEEVPVVEVGVGLTLGEF
jgi:hypothetical protein